MLAAVRFDVTWTRDRLRSTALRLEQSRLETAAGLLDRVLNGVRRISQALRPFVLDHLGLRAALETLAEEVQARDQVKCRLRLDIPEIGSNDGPSRCIAWSNKRLTTAGLRAGTTGVDVSPEGCLRRSSPDCHRQRVVRRRRGRRGELGSPEQERDGPSPRGDCVIAPRAPAACASRLGSGSPKNCSQGNPVNARSVRIGSVKKSHRGRRPADRRQTGPSGLLRSP